MTEPVLLGLCLLVPLAVLVALVLWLRRLRRRAAEEMRRELGEFRILLLDDFVRFFGVQSRGLRQIRGNGCLALTRDEVRFRMWAPRREISIPRSDIEKVEKAGSHLGKYLFRPLLKIHFTNDRGEADAAAWHVRRLPEWLQKLP